MNTDTCKALCLRLIPLLVLSGVGTAEEHAAEALKHTDQATRSAGDSAAIREHAMEALKHIDAAKAANRENPQTLKHLEHSEADLNEAVPHARKFNSQSAGAEAGDARHHLEQTQGKDDASARH